MTEDDVLAFVKRYGYTRVTREADWKGYEAWFPSVGGPEAVVGCRYRCWFVAVVCG